MFGKLLKYEFKAAGKLYGVLFLILAIVSSIFGLMLSNSISSGITSDDAVSAVYSFFTIVFFSTCTALVISNLVITIRRFYQNIFGREAYLTWTLPANAHQIILSKMTMATIWYIASVLGIFLSIIWMAFLVALGSGVDASRFDFFCIIPILVYFHWPAFPKSSHSNVLCSCLCSMDYNRSTESSALFHKSFHLCDYLCTICWFLFPTAYSVFIPVRLYL